MISISKFSGCGLALGAVSFAALTLQVLPAFAATTLCDSGKMLATNWEVNVSDIGPEGVSAGDLRYAAGELFAENGDKIASVFVRREVLPGGSLVTEMDHVFADGDLFVRSIEMVDRTPLSTEKITSPALNLGITGGTGAYRNLTGHGVYRLVGADDIASARYEVEFEIDCE